MSTEFRAKVFKSGNSIALRLPKALGIKEGTEMVVREEQNKFTFQPVHANRKIDVTKFAGKCPGLKQLTPEERMFDPSPRIWDDPDGVGQGGDHR